MKDCESCVHEHLSPMSDTCRECGLAMLNYEERKPMTNADRIRQMTDEELADMLVDIGECDRRCPAKAGDCIFSDSSCRSAWLDWLKSPVEVDNGT